MRGAEGVGRRQSHMIAHSCVAAAAGVGGVRQKASDETGGSCRHVERGVL